MSNNELNVFATPQQGMAKPASAATAMAMNRQAQEVQAAMVVAKRFPRDERESADRILAACTRKTLAESAMYSFARGGQEVTGPSIRLAEELARDWGNIDFGFIELENKAAESTVMAYAWDLETNTRQSKIFTVPHSRYAKGTLKPLTDPRDIYEMVANQASRRVRSCILAVIPGDVTEMAVKQCELTLASGAEPLESRIGKMVAAFNAMEITSDMLAGFIGKSVDAFTAQDLVRLSKIYRSIKDGVVGSDYFTEKMKASAPTEKPAEPAAIAAPPTASEAPTPELGEMEELSLDDL